MSLLAEIQADALSETTPVNTLLRKVLVLASDLESNLLEDWVRHEMTGYPKDVEVPDYRRMDIQFKANIETIVRFYHGRPITPHTVKKATGREDIAVFKCRQPLNTINPTEIAKSDGSMMVNFDNVGILVQRQLTEGHVIHSFWGEVPSSQILGIIEAVRDRVLSFVLKLKKSYPEAGQIEQLTTKVPEVEKTVNNIYNNTINGNVGAVHAENSTVNMTVNQGDFQQLWKELSKHGVEKDDFLELEAALQAEPKIEENKRFGPRVAAWMGKMAGKAASGSWDVTIKVGTTLLQAALLKFYGLK